MMYFTVQAVIIMIVYTVDNRAAVLRVFITNLQLLQDACNEAEQVSVPCEPM